eukprot:1790999-Pyramimonas_sp.AAC.1
MLATFVRIDHVLRVVQALRPPLLLEVSFGLAGRHGRFHLDGRHQRRMPSVPDQRGDPVAPAAPPRISSRHLNPLDDAVHESIRQRVAQVADRAHSCRNCFARRHAALDLDQAELSADQGPLQLAPQVDARLEHLAATELRHASHD